MPRFNQFQGRFQLKTFNWYKIFNLAEFLALNIGSKEYNLNLFGVGQSRFIAYSGNVASIMYLDEFMPIDLYAPEMYEKLNYAVYRDDLTDDVYFGFLVVDEN